MKSKSLKPIIWALAFVTLVGLACGASDGGTDLPTAAPPPTAAPQADAPTAEPVEPPPAASGAVSNLQDVRNAVIQIEAQGSFVDPQFGLQMNAAGRGSGFIIDPSGIAVTNNHVVTGAALLKVWIGGDTSKTYNARVLGVSECSDLAVIKIEGSDFAYLDWYADPVQVGLDVYTAGFPLGDPEYTLTRGIISKESADGETNWASVDSVIMHDATINPGNSGGPLVSPNGQIVAVNYAAYKAADQYFAIGPDVARPVIERLAAGNDVNSIGVNGTSILSDDGALSGVWVSSVKSGSPADQSGLQGGDIIYTLEDVILGTDGTMQDYCDILRSHSATDTLDMTIIRFNTEQILEGQLNGRALEVVDSFASGNTGGDNSGGDTGSGNTGGGETTGGELPAYFTEEWDAGAGNWSYFLMNGNEAEMNLYTDAGRIFFDLAGQNLWVYLTYDPYIYEDVYIAAEAENRGKNTNNVSLICRYNSDGWYEFNIGNDGLYSILAYDAGAQEYSLLFNGGSTAIRSGKDTNVYLGVCQGNTLTLYINGELARSVTDSRFNFREGQVGISVSSFDVTPINVEFERVEIGQP